MKGKELILREFAGQNCDVKIFIGEDTGEASISFVSQEGYGNPSITKDKLEEILVYIKKLEE